jgi:poly-gamma-glutamate capsule biosynthesis protein CapA/YwtB (metallophosphatase superfamily)
MYRWFVNQKPENVTSESNASAASRPVLPKKPRATTAQDVFAAQHKDQIRLQLQAELKEKGATPQGGNVVFHRVVKNAMYDQLPADEKAKFDQLATEHNQRINEPPPADHIHKYGILRSIT